MTKEYVFYIELDGPFYGMKDGSLETDENPSEESWGGALQEMAYDHVSSYIDIEGWEEENGVEMEFEAKAEAWDPERHPQRLNGRSRYDSIIDSMKQDDEGRWYVEK